jgi:S1-C subfamily serine protease
MSSYNPFRGDENPFEDDPAQQIFADEKRDRKENFRVKNFTPKLSFLIISILVLGFIFSYTVNNSGGTEASSPLPTITEPIVREQVIPKVSTTIADSDEQIVKESVPVEVISETPLENNLLDQNIITQKTVQVVVENCNLETEDSALGTSVGSGVLITDDGYIVSNSHVIEDCYGEIYIATTEDVDTPTEITYIAKIIHDNPELDLVLLKIVSFENGSSIGTQFEYFDLFSTDELSLGETIQIWGYPTARGDGTTYSLQINLTKGTISGFESDYSLKRGWIVTDADISYGNSGGAALDETGRLVGIPTFGRTEGASWLGYLRSADVLKSWLMKVSPELFSIPSLIIKENEISNIPRYNREDWNSWIDNDDDCQNTRHENLQLESFIEVSFVQDNSCYVSSGKWFDPYNGEFLYEASQIDIDHFIPLYNVHISGGWLWSEEKKTQFANNLNDPDLLIAVESRTNREKSSHTPDQWKPENTSYWCEYAYDWIRIKYEWNLSVTQNEWDALQEMTATCPDTFLYAEAINNSHLFSAEKIARYSNS